MKKVEVMFLIFFSITISSEDGNAQCEYLDTLGITNLQDSLTTFFPTICKNVTLGTSVLGREIVAMKFSDNVFTDENEPEILLTACMHGDETDPEQVMMKLARQLCIQYNSNQQITDLINEREIWIIPVLNPDGLVGHSYGRRPNAHGVDLNRNYGYMWNAEDFDPFPFSEPETKLLRDFILSRNFNVMIDYHSGLQGIIYPWYYKTDNCPDFSEISYLANQYDVNSGYPVGQFAVTSGADLYPTNGAMVEFAYGTLGIYAFAVELHNFSAPIFANWCEIFAVNKPSILMMLEKAGEGISGVVTDINTGLPVYNATIIIEGRLPSYSGNINGDYHRFLLAGTYMVTISANGYSDQTATIFVSNGTSTIHDFQLTPQSSFAANKIIACRNFNNYNDPAETWKALGMNDGQYYAIGDTGYVVLDMGVPVVDISGKDITVYGNASISGDAFELFYSSSIDGPWIMLGTGSTTTSFDLNGVTSARFFRLEDNGAGPENVFGAGFNLDAVTAVNLLTGMEDLEVSTSIKAFPNPVHEILNIENKDFINIREIKILDGNGRQVLRSGETSSIDFTSFPVGIYFIQFYSNTAIYTHKIIKK